jgi:hypothetical protein
MAHALAHTWTKCSPIWHVGYRLNSFTCHWWHWRHWWHKWWHLSSMSTLSAVRYGYLSRSWTRTASRVRLALLAACVSATDPRWASVDSHGLESLDLLSLSIVARQKSEARLIWRSRRASRAPSVETETQVLLLLLLLLRFGFWHSPQSLLLPLLLLLVLILVDMGCMHWGCCYTRSTSYKRGMPH